MKNTTKLQISHWTELKKVTFSAQEYATDVDSGNVSDFTVKDNNNIAFISTFVGELPISHMRQFDRKKKEHVEMSCPAAVSV